MNALALLVVTHVALFTQQPGQTPLQQRAQRAFADTVRSVRLRLEIDSVVPNPATPGSKVLIQLSREPLGDSVVVSFGKGVARVDFVKGRFIYVTVPNDLKPGERPPIVVHAEGRASAPYLNFAVSAAAAAAVSQSRESPSKSSLLMWGFIGVVVIVFWVLRYRAAAASKKASALRQELEQVRLGMYGPTPKTTAVPGEAKVPEVPDELISACAAGHCVLFAGSGLAAQAGFPTRHELVLRLLPQAVRTSEEQAELGRALSAEKVDVVAEFIAARLDHNALSTAVADIYGQSIPDLPPIHAQLQGIPFASALTTAWDHVLERTFASRQPFVVTSRTQDLALTFRAEPFFLVKLNGDSRQPETFHFTTDEFQRALFENERFSKFLVSQVLAKSILFVGKRLPGIERFFSSIRVKVPEDCVHFAVAPFTDDWALQEQRFFSKYRVRLIGYTPTAGHPEVAGFVARLRAAVEERRATVTHAPAAGVTLHKVRLSNIGPFKNLSLDFQNGWNVLLGNNGCGKSTLLKAIALGLCGDDIQAALFAQRLLRQGEPSGSIELGVGATTYRTELWREQDRVRVHSSQLTPLQSGDWVVLGFPPLRGVSVTNPQGPTPWGSTIPVVHDLLPLLAGPTDGRLDNLKQWIVNLDVGSTEDANARLRQSFFDLVTTLTPGSQVSFDRVDRQTWQVYVKTEDGEIPIDQLSQGMNATIAWVGTLLQRMYEIHPHADHPESEPALVLIDEIDAHLHPEWQQAIVPLITRHFPGLQIIATTHSPLIIARMRPEQVLTVRRNPEQPADIEISRALIDFEGMRADQILTSPMFGLSHTREDTRVERYSELLGLATRTEEEERELQTLRKKLAPLLSSGDTQMERRVERALRQVLQSELEPAAQVSTAGGAALSVEMEGEIRRQLADVFSKTGQVP